MLNSSPPQTKIYGTTPPYASYIAKTWVPGPVFDYGQSTSHAQSRAASERRAPPTAASAASLPPRQVTAGKMVDAYEASWSAHGAALASLSEESTQDDAPLPTRTVFSGSEPMPMRKKRWLRSPPRVPTPMAMVPPPHTASTEILRPGAPAATSSKWAQDGKPFGQLAPRGTIAPVSLMTSFTTMPCHTVLNRGFRPVFANG